MIGKNNWLTVATTEFKTATIFNTQIVAWIISTDVAVSISTELVLKSKYATMVVTRSMEENKESTDRVLIL